MTKTHPTNPYNKGIGAILVAVTLATIAALIIWAVAISMGAENTEKDALIANIEAGYPENAENVTEAFKLWGFPAFNKTMVFNVEACYHNSYYKELPSNDELAKKAADHFIKTYYDNIDLSNKEAVTHGLANSFIHAVGDRYGVYRTKEEQESYSSGLAGELVGIGVMVSKSEEGLIHVNSPIKNSPAEAAGIIAGDIIIAVDGTLVADVGYDAGSNLISGKEGTTVII